MNSGAVTAGPIGHATHITQPVTAEVFPAVNKLFNTQGQFNYDGQTGRVLVYGLPTLTSISPDKDSNNGSTDINFTLTGTNFGTSQTSVNGEVNFIQVNENDPNNPWGTVYNPSSFTSWSNTSIAGSINLPSGKYRIEVSVRGENTIEEIFFYKGTGTYEVIVGEPVEMVLIPKGTYTLSQFNPPQITFTHNYSIGKYEITNSQYRQWPAAQSHHGSTAELNNSTYDSYPVRFVNWMDAVQYCNWLSTTEGLNPCYSWTDVGDHNTYTVNLTANGYRLPTEAEWEYACRGGTTTNYYWGDTVDPLKCWFYNDYTPYPTMPHAVGYGGNHPFGLYDMSGNVWEWCHNVRESIPAGGNDPKGPDTGSYRIVRGGAWTCNSFSCRSYHRPEGYNPSIRVNDFGFRIVRTR